MESDKKKEITVQATINSPIETVWEKWTSPEDIKNWNYASDDWQCPDAENDLRAGGKFSYRMEANDGSAGFDFWGIYDNIKANELIEYTMGDGRKAVVKFLKIDENNTEIVETFEAEETNSLELQQTGWQAILDNFRRYTET